MTTLSCTLHGALDLRLTPTEPRALGPHDVRLRLGAGGICGSDLHYYQHGRVGAFVIREPLVPGHEASGVVDAVGGAVTRVKAGDKVAIDPSHPCGQCDYCRGGRMNLCRKMFFLGSASIFPHAQGLFAQSFVMPERQLTPVTEPEITLGEIACAEPLSVGLHAVQRAGSLLGKRVLVTGGGTIGCMCVIAARLAGAAEVVVADIAERPLAMARTVGADSAVRSDSRCRDARRPLRRRARSRRGRRRAGHLPDRGAARRPHRPGRHAAGRVAVPGQQRDGARTGLRRRLPRQWRIRPRGAGDPHRAASMCGR